MTDKKTFTKAAEVVATEKVPNPDTRQRVVSAISRRYDMLRDNGTEPEISVYDSTAKPKKAKKVERFNFLNRERTR